jgi:hypothetical protein
VSDQLQATAALPPMKEPRVPIVLEAVWVPQLVWTLWSREKSLAPAGSQTPARSYRGAFRKPRVEEKMVGMWEVLGERRRAKGMM